MPTLSILLLLLTAFPHHGYRAADGTWVRPPHHYRRHPNTGTAWTATCRDGSLSFTHTRAGTCSYHHGVQSWHVGT